MSNKDSIMMTSSALGQIDIHGTGSQLTFTCSKATTEALEKRVKYVKFTIKTSERGQ